MASLTKVLGTTFLFVALISGAISLSGDFATPQVSEECQNGIPLIGSPFAEICETLR